MRNIDDLKEAIVHGPFKKSSPEIMAASVIIVGLLPVMWRYGAGADVMKRIATPMGGGVCNYETFSSSCY